MVGFFSFISLPALLFCAENVQQLLEERIRNGGSTGMVVAIVDGPKVKIYASGQLSIDNTKKVDEETLFEIGSITKVFTTLLLQEKVLKGTLSLLDPVERYLPPGLHLPMRHGIAIHFLHLATHTSALPYCPTNYVVRAASNPYASYTKQEFWDFFQEYQLTRDPGERHSYSNVGMGLLGNVLAEIEGIGYEELVQTHICQSLGMKNTHIHLTPQMRDRLARGHLGKKIVDNWDFPAFPGAGALRSCVKDLLLFLRANMGQIDTPLANAMNAAHRRICESDDLEVDVALGWYIMHRFSPEIIWHNGGTGGYRSFLGFCKSRQKGVVILSNSSTKIDDMGFHLIDERYPLEAVNKEILLDPIILKTYCGKYRHRLGLSCTVYQDKGRLFVEVKGFPDAPALALSENRFFFNEIAAQISFRVQLLRGEDHDRYVWRSALCI